MTMGLVERFLRYLAFVSIRGGIPATISHLNAARPRENEYVFSHFQPLLKIRKKCPYGTPAGTPKLQELFLVKATLTLQSTLYHQGEFENVRSNASRVIDGPTFWGN